MEIRKIIIVAMTENNVIGRDNTIPWHISDDLKLFKRNTINNTVIMGRKTYESIGKPLPKRNNIVVSSRLKTDNEIEICDTFEKSIEFAQKLGKDIYFIGGNQIYKSALKIADYIYLSFVKKNYSGNVYFPKYDKKQWKEIYSEEYEKFKFVKLKHI